jgi:hypothetical protein
MFWIVMLVIAWLAGVAGGWISVSKTGERVLISLETGKARSAFSQLKHAGERLIGR